MIATNGFAINSETYTRVTADYSPFYDYREWAGLEELVLAWKKCKKPAIAEDAIFVEPTITKTQITLNIQSYSRAMFSHSGRLPKRIRRIKKGKQ